MKQTNKEGPPQSRMYLCNAEVLEHKNRAYQLRLFCRRGTSGFWCSRMKRASVDHSSRCTRVKRRPPPRRRWRRPVPGCHAADSASTWPKPSTWVSRPTPSGSRTPWCSYAREGRPSFWPPRTSSGRGRGCLPWVSSHTRPLRSTAGGSCAKR